jgi:hypothetical protein
MTRKTYTSYEGDTVICYTGAEEKELRKLYKDTGFRVFVHRFSDGSVEARENYYPLRDRFEVKLR